MNDRHLDKIERILEKVNDIDVKLGKHEIILEKNTDSLIEHMRRTDLLEEQIKHVEKHVTRIEAAYAFFLKLCAFFAFFIPFIWGVFVYFKN